METPIKKTFEIINNSKLFLHRQIVVNNRRQVTGTIRNLVYSDRNLKRVKGKPATTARRQLQKFRNFERCSN